MAVTEDNKEMHYAQQSRMNGPYCYVHFSSTFSMFLTEETKVGKLLWLAEEKKHGKRQWEKYTTKWNQI